MVDPLSENGVCPRCRRDLEGGWCPECAHRRRAWILWLLFLLLPALAFGACTVGVFASFGGSKSDYSLLFPVALATIVISPIAGIIYLIVSALRKNNGG